MTKPTQVFPPLPMRLALLSVLAAWSASTCAIGLGSISVQSSLSQPFEASVPVISASPADIATGCLKARAEDLEGIPLAPVIAYAGQDGQAAAILLSSERAINEPSFRLEVRVGCNQITSRTYYVLLDPAATGAASVRRKLRRYVPDTTSVLPVPNLTDIQKPHPRVPKVAAEPASVLKISAPETLEDRLKGAEIVKPDWNLKMDMILSLSDKDKGADLMPMWRTLQARLAAVLRNEDPYDELVKQLGDARKTAAEGKKQSAQSRQQAASEKAAMQAKLDSMYSPAWVAGLGGASLLLAAALGAVVYRRRQPRKTSEPWHHTTEPYLGSATPTMEATLEAAGASFAGDAQEPTFPAFPVRTNADLDRQAIDYAASLNAEMAQSASDVALVLVDTEQSMLDQDPSKAIATLERHCRGSQLSPAPALYLLELYRAVGQEVAYGNLRDHIEAMFHIDTPEWNADWMQEARSLASFPAIDQSINALTNNPEQLPFLQGLLLVVDNRFDFYVYRDIIRRIMMVIAQSGHAEREAPAVPSEEAFAATAQEAEMPVPACESVAAPVSVPSDFFAPHPDAHTEPPALVTADAAADFSAPLTAPLMPEEDAAPARAAANDAALPLHGDLLSLSDLGLYSDPAEDAGGAAAQSAPEHASGESAFPLDLPDLDFPGLTTATSLPRR